LNGTLTQVFASKDVLGTGNSTLLANDTYTVTDGNGGNNYAVSLITAPGTITPLPNVPPVLVPDGLQSASLMEGESAGGAQAIPWVADALSGPVLTRIQEPSAWPQGPVTFASTQAPTPEALVVAPLTAPVPTPVPAPAVLEAEDNKPQPRLLPVPVRPRKQDRN
jgi:hypothetical protein